ncbi:MAG: TonB-dependent receptor [Gemmatimonadetes bacterium]|nr:TonB-dependent receptor [Gemmatimonadota bacterium]MYG35095.1 TonB-dependent receptor [Gemmatimonadota bacterium]
MPPEVAVSLARRAVRLSIATVSALALATAAATAQTTGTIRGTVTDAADSALPGVVVTASASGVDTEGVTNADGAFAFADLAAGDYILTATLFGYASRELQVTVRAGAVEVVAIVLQPFFQLDPISVVAEEPTVFARNFVAAPMMRQQSSITSVTSVIDNLPGVSVQEGDAYAFDDWSSNVVMRGFQSTINDVQIGTTIDGFPNGTSDYWGGAKANRFVDPINLGGVEVSQGTADIASRSVEALGGTLNFLTADPAEEASRTASITIGENRGQRFAARVETGTLFGGTTRAWVAAIRQEATDWMEGSARNEREHFAAKVVSSHGALDLTGYFSYDDILENNYQRLYSEADFHANPRWDRLIGHWPGVPYLNQSYRRGWGTLRTNTFAYLSADWSVGELISLSAGAYHHRNRGRGDWLPPYIVDVVDDGGGPESELAGRPPVRGGSQLGVIRFVDGNGAAVGPVPGCTSSYIFNYYGSGGPEVDPACHPGATAVQSYRHSHYGKDRTGASIDGEWSAVFGAGGGSALRAGIWYEDSRRHLGRDWHRILDPVVGLKGDEQPYWHQYEWDFPQDVFRWFVEETLYFGPFELTAGVKQFLISVSREDQFGIDPDLGVDSDSDLLLSGGVTYETPVDGLDLFVGYAENFRAISSTLLEVPGRSVNELEPETASNIDVGVQYAGDRLALSATLYSIDFDNRIFYVGPLTPAGPNYLIPGGGAYFNAGGIETRGIELAATAAVSERTSLYTALTLNDSKYLGTGDPLIDASQGIVPGTDVAGVPPRLWVVSVDRDGPLGGGVSTKYTAARRVSLTADWYTDPYWTVDAYISFRGEAPGDLFRSTEFSIVANNVLDSPYLSTITENAAWLGASRTVSMTVTVSF